MSQQYVTAIYRAALAERLQGLGYEVEVNERTGAPEIKGFSREYIVASSPRRKEVERKAREIKERLEAGAAVVKEGAGLYHAAAHMDRSSKQYDRDLVRERHREMDARYGRQAQNSVAKARERGPIIHVGKDVAEHARSAVGYALNKAAEQEKMLDLRDVMTDALRHGLGRTTYSAVYSEFAVIRERGGFINRTREPRRQQKDASREQKRRIKPPLLRKDEARESNSCKSTKRLPARSLLETVERLQSDGAVIEIVDQIQRLNAVAQEQSVGSKRTLSISSSRHERAALNSLVRRELQAAGNISQRENLTKILVNRMEASGPERSLASSYYPDKDIIKFNRTSKVYGIKAGDEGRVVASDHELNTITVAFADGRTVRYNPARLSGVTLYREAERAFAEGDRVQFHAPIKEQGVTGGRLGVIEQIADGQFRVALGDGRHVEVAPQKYRHLDYGYAVANFTPQMRQQFDRTIINLDMRGTELSPNDYLKFLAEHLAPSQSGNDVRLYTNSKLALNEKFQAQLGFGTVVFGREKREVSERIGGFSPALNREGSSGESLTHVGVRAGKEKQGNARSASRGIER
jgi:hypothetical protein